MVQKLIPAVGYGWTMRAMGFLALGCLVVCNIWQNPNCRLGKPVLSWSSPPSRNYHMPYLEFLCFSSFGASILPPTISAPLAIINISRKELINLLLILNGVGITGRTIPVYIANQYAGPMNILFLVTIASVACSYGMVAVTTRGGLYAWTVAYGFVRNAVQGMFPVVLGSLTADKDSKKAGVRMSMMFTIAVLTGPPINGVLIAKDNGRYIYAQIFAASSMLLGFIVLCGARFVRSWKVLFCKI